MINKKKLIEVALPLDAINKASAREKSIRHGHPSTLHLWWARRPLAAACAVIFSQIVDDPSSHPDLFPTEKAQEKERKRLFKIIEELVQWENVTNEEVLIKANEEIWQSWRRACAENADHPRAKELFDRHHLPSFHDPFAGGGSLPLEAQRLGLTAYATDLNPVAVLINKAMIEIPPRFNGKPPVNPERKKEKSLFVHEWKGAEGLAEDICYYGKWIRDEAEDRIGHLYPQAKVTEEMAKERPDLGPIVGRRLKVIAWIWARTVKSPNPAFANIEVPLVSTFLLSTKTGKEAYIEPVIRGNSYRFAVKKGKPSNVELIKNGTKSAKANFSCLFSGTPITADYIKAEAKAGRIGSRLMAVVAEGDKGRIYLPPTQTMETIAVDVSPKWKPEVEFFQQALGFRVGNYGMTKWSDIFTPRQLIALATFSDLIESLREKVKYDAVLAGFPIDDNGLNSGGNGHVAYSEAISIYAAFALDKGANYWSSLCAWHVSAEKMVSTFGRQVVPMIWDFTEANPFSDSSGNWMLGIEQASKMVLELGIGQEGYASQDDAQTQTTSCSKVISTDPPYYDNIGYADLSDFFYVWLRRSLKTIYPNLFATLTVPKSEELVATPHRHGTKDQAEEFFLTGMARAMHRLADQTHPAFPITIFYAFKQSESDSIDGTASTGWETFLDAIIRAGLSISGTWPVRTEYTSQLKTKRSALASSIVLVCRKRDTVSITATRREFLIALKKELPVALTYLQRSNIAPVDLAQAAIGPGMSIFTRYTKVLDANGLALSVREALALINQTLDEVLADQDGDVDADTRWALAWFEQSGFSEGEYGVAETLSKAKNTSVSGMVEAGILTAKASKVCLLKPAELPENWDPSTDARLTVWEMVHHLIRVLEADGEQAAAELIKKLGSKAEVARELAYRLFTLCERKKRASEALSYNSLVQSWPEITRLSKEGAKSPAKERTIIDEIEQG